MMDVLFPLSLNMFYEGKKESPGLFNENWCNEQLWQNIVFMWIEHSSTQVCESKSPQQIYISAVEQHHCP